MFLIFQIRIAYVFWINYICNKYFGYVWKRDEFLSFNQFGRTNWWNAYYFDEEVAEEAKRKSEEAHKKFFQEIREYIRKQQAKWGKEYNVSFSNEWFLRF